ncbi:alanyl-tRNA editing protein [Candidatus Dependentiae bacterium]|nr:alanyl-tRNA editing protein [Candidatus Dependentiae bacterium]
MQKTFWEDPYKQTLITRIISVNGNEVLPEKTIAFSFSGGQESDKAWFNNLEVVSSRMADGLIFYTLPENHGLNAGDTIEMKIDWHRRHRLMRLHFTAELILEIVIQSLGLEKVGAHISESKARIDFKSDSNISEHFNDILQRYNEIIHQNLPISKGWLDEATQRRYWKIDRFAQVPCGGTHVNTTGEVGYVTLKRDRPGKGIERIEIRLINA